jgi:hypothetical protein
MGNSMSRNTPVLTKVILDTAFGLPGIILLGLLGGIAVGLAVGRSAVIGVSNPSAVKLQPALAAVLAPVLAIDYGRGTTLLVGPPVPWAGVVDGTQIAKAGSCAGARSPIDRN